MWRKRYEWVETDGGAGMETLLFWLLAVIALIAAVSMIIQRNPVHSVLFLIVTLLSLAGLFLLLSAHFLAVIQIIVYAGAIMVLFLFVVMLLDVRRTETAPSRVKLQKTLGILLGVIFFLETILVLRSGVIRDMAAAAATPLAPDFGTAVALGRALLTDYFFPLQLAAVLLFVALIGAVVLSKRRW
jgi:NADH-quinone oxidoreductase subunit J